MIISCPACSARFNVADHLIGAQGRVVRCAKCGHKWQQMPDGQVAAPPPPPPPPPPPMPVEPSVPAAPASSPATKGRVPSPLPKLGDIPLEMPAQGAAEREPQEDVDLAAALDRVAGVVAEADAQNAFQSVAAKPGEVGGESEAGEDQMQGGDFDFGEAEPIPEVFTQVSSSSGKSAKGKGGGKGALLTLLTLLVLLGGLGAAAYFLRTKVVEFYPDAAAYYEMLGIEAEVLGSGLKFRNVTSERVIENNVEVLIVRGVVANISDKPRDLPMIKLSLYDGGNMVVQDKVMPPPEESLPPNESAGFKIGIESPAAAARRFEVTFAPKPQE